MSVNFYQIQKIKKFAKEYDISIDETIKIFSLIAYERRTDAYIQNGDAEDEQAYIIKESLNNIADSIDKIDLTI